MKRYRIKKYVDAKKMTQSDAEEALGYKIQNLLFSNEGYVVTDNESGIQWVPMSVFEKEALAAHSMSDKCRVMISDLQEGYAVLMKYRKYGKPSLNERKYIIEIMNRMRTLSASIENLVTKYIDKNEQKF